MGRKRIDKSADEMMHLEVDASVRREGMPQERYGLELLLRKPSLRASLKKDSEECFRQMEITKDTRCGIGCIRGEWLQTFAKENVYVFVYGILGCFYGSYFAYFNGTITTLEKRFKIPSKTMGIIATGSDMMHIFVSPILSYYTGKGHRPRWVGLGIYTVVLSCILSALPHFIYGAGEDVLEYTKEYGGGGLLDNDLSSNYSRKQMCNMNTTETNCVDEGEGMMPTIILFVTQIIQGLGGCLYFTVGTAYMDDNIKKSKTPALMSFSYVLRMLGPAFGYWMSSICLKIFVVPSLTPVIKESDPRWIGAWWLGNIFIGFLLFLLATLIMLFPKTLPRAAARNALAEATNSSQSSQTPANFEDMAATFKRLLLNPTFNCNNLAATFNVLWYMAYWIFLPKYIETQYRQSASAANFVTGTTTLLFSTCGILIAGAIITKYRPRARLLAGWNIIIGVITTLCLLSYSFLGCAENDEQTSVMASRFLTNFSQTCNRKCNCEYVMYTPVCSEAGETFVSPCHAGCKNSIEINGTKVYTDCECIDSDGNQRINGKVFDGACPIDCNNNFKIFLVLVCLVTFIGSTGRPSNFLVQLRCVEERDKSVSLGFGMMFLCLFAFMPSPILFGYILDTTCLIWGKTCETTGNCWLYDSKRLRYTMNFTAVLFVGIATLIDVIIWYLVKDLKIFDDENNKNIPES